jgi:hypothetical protein
VSITSARDLSRTGSSIPHDRAKRSWKGTELTRHTLAEILKRSGRLSEFKINPQSFMTAIAKEISGALHELILGGIKYEKVPGAYWEQTRIERDAEAEIVRYLSNLYEVPSRVSSRAQWCALEHASMPMMQAGNFAKNASSRLRANRRRTTAWPEASVPRTWKTDLARSRPIRTAFMVDLLARWMPHLLTAAIAGVVHPIKWLLQCRYMQIEGMAELTPPLLDTEPTQLPPLAAWPLATPNSTPISTTLTECVRRNWRWPMSESLIRLKP